jgi:hypothetical protein
MTRAPDAFLITKISERVPTSRPVLLVCLASTQTPDGGLRVRSIRSQGPGNRAINGPGIKVINL